MTDVQFKVTDNAPKVESAFKKQLSLALEAIGQTAEGYAKEDCPVDTGRLRNSISYAVGEPSENDVVIGTNVEYAPQVEYRDVNHKTGKAHFLRDAAANHSDEYQKLVDEIMRDR